MIDRKTALAVLDDFAEDPLLTQDEREALAMAKAAIEAQGVSVSSEPQVGDVWAHVEKPILVDVLHIAMLEATMERCVVYKHEGAVWVRTLPVFVQRFEPTTDLSSDPSRGQPDTTDGVE